MVSWIGWIGGMDDGSELGIGRTIEKRTIAWFEVWNEFEISSRDRLIRPLITSESLNYNPS